MSAPLSPYHKSGNFIFISGQVGLDDSTETIPEDFESQAKNVFKSLARVLDSAGSDKSNIVKTTVYMTDLTQFERMNELYIEFFESHKPARTTVGVAALPQFPGDPKIFIEIDAIAEIAG